MKILKYGLIAAAVLGFVGFVYYRVQTIPQPPMLEINFGQAGAAGFKTPSFPKGTHFIKGKVTHGEAARKAAED